MSNERTKRILGTAGVAIFVLLVSVNVMFRLVDGDTSGVLVYLLLVAAIVGATVFIIRSGRRG